MKFFELFKKVPDKPPVKKRRVRRYDGAAQDRFTQDWVTGSLSASNEILPYLNTLIARSRDLFQNNDYAKGFLIKLKTNLVSAQARNQGMKLQCKAELENGEANDTANTAIEAAWETFCKPKNCSVTKRLSMADIITIAAQSMARDGSVLIRKIRKFKNKSGFALQLLDIDYLDFEYNENQPGKNKVVGGVEIDKWGSPVAYHLFSSHPGDDTYYRAGKQYIRIPAEDIIYPFQSDRAEQLHGVPWYHASLLRLRMLGKYEESEAIAARIGASKMGFFKPEEGRSYTGDDLTGFDDEEGITTEPDFITSAEPGLFEELPAGVDFEAFDPDHPTTAFEGFCKHMLRGASAGVGQSYINFANDPGAANFASMRGAELSERDMWMLLQGFIQTHILDDIFEEWLRIQILSGRLQFPISNFDLLNKPSWMGKRWAWIDPAKDAKANETLVKMKVKTIGDVIAEAGGDFDDKMAKWAREIPVMGEIFGGEDETEL